MDCYLDNSATTRPTQAVIDAVTMSMAEGFHNPSALYAPALTAEKRMDACRVRVTGALRGGKTVVFTSGGTEAANLAVLGSLQKRGRKGRILLSAGEHPAVREPCLWAGKQGFEVLEIPLTPEGHADCEAFCALANPDTILVCVMQVNNETGALQPLERLLGIRDRQCPGAVFLADGVQGFLKVSPGLFSLGIDAYVLSGHKIHGPKGIGALVLNDAGRIQPVLFGGGQEQGLRPGTENTPGIAGLDAAIATYPAENRMRQLKLRLFERLREAVPGLVVNGPDPSSAEAADHILNLSFPPVRAETMLHALESEGVFVSSGSACSSKSRRTSAVLRAMRIPEPIASCAVRFSLSPFTTDGEIDCAADCAARKYRQLRHLTRR